MIYGDVAREYKMQIYYIVQRIFWFYQGIIVLKPTRKTLSSIRSEYCIPNWKGYSTENYKKRRKIL